MYALNDILAVIMGGGQGSRLYPLTKERAKPAVPLAGKYRLIDIPISNCINSDIHKIAVLTQFNSVSLHKHISSAYHFDVFHTGWIQVWAAEQTLNHRDWYQGTADAVRKQLNEIKSARAHYVLILAGDHLYRMDYARMAQFHWEKKADVTIAVQPVLRKDASRYGILKRDKSELIVRFAEKPKTSALLNEMVSQTGSEKRYFGSMGIYMFTIEVLEELLSGTDYEDFGKHVIPYSIKTHNVYGFYFGGFWADIGTIRSFYEVNLKLAESDRSFSLIDEGWPIYTHARFLPSSEIVKCKLEQVLLTEGCWIENAEISHSVIGLRSQIRAGSKIINSVLMGADYYGFFRHGEKNKNEISLGIGKDCYIEGAIIDKNVRVGNGVVIKPFPRGTDIETEDWVVKDGIVVIPKGTTIMPGTRIAPDTKVD